MYIVRIRQLGCLLISLLGLLIANKVLAITQSGIVRAMPRTVPPRVSITAYASDYAVAQTDVMLPMLDQAHLHLLYADPSVGVSSDGQGYVDLGVGYRWIEDRWIDKRGTILGVYAFGGYSRIENNAHLWVVNPGVEAFGTRWDLHLNGYVPIGDRNMRIYTRSPSGLPYGQSTPCSLSALAPCPSCTGGITGLAGPLFFSGHTLFTPALLPSQIFSQHVGDGVDIKFSYQILPRRSFKAYVGGYFFAPSQANNILGTATGLEYWLDRNAKLFISYSYDTARHSTGAVGCSVEFGGLRKGHRADPSLSERFTDPIERYLAVLGRGSKIPSRISPQVVLSTISQAVPGNNNIAFFSQNGSPNNGGMRLTLENCTFEHPCGPSDLTNVSAIALNTLLPNTQMYFNGGTYSALDVPGGANQVSLQAGQSISSRTPDYTQAAVGTGRSTFHGGFALSNGNILNGVIIPLDSALGVGYSVLTDAVNGGAQNYWVNCSQITGMADIGNGGSSGVLSNSEVVGLDLEPGDYANTSSLTIVNSTVPAIATGGANVTLLGSQVGPGELPIFLGQGGDTLLATNTTVYATASGVGSSAIALITSDPSETIQFNGGTLIAEGTGGAAAVIKAGSGNFIFSPSTVCIVNGNSVSC